MLLHYLGKLKNHSHRHMPEDIIDTLQVTSGESISVQMVDILNTFCEQTHANN